MVNQENCSDITEILLVGFKLFQGSKIPIFILFLAVYLLICCENLLIIYVILSSVGLRSPMFFIIENMAICELITVTNIVPKLLNDIISERATVTIFGCIVQLHIFGTASNMYCFYFSLMSYDRYLAICNPLRYGSVVSNTIYLHSIIALWICSFLCTVVLSILESQMKFCQYNTIDHFYCDFSPFINLATSDTTYVRLFSAVVATCFMLITVLFVFVTYILIIHTICKIPSSSGRKKTFSTCSSHLFTVSLQYSLSLGVYMLPTNKITPGLGKMFTFINFFWAPVVNSMIYSFRNKTFRVNFMTKMKTMLRTF